MRLRIEIINLKINDLHDICTFYDDTLIGQKILTLEEIEDAESNLTDIVKQLQDYRLAQICGGE